MKTVELHARVRRAVIIEGISECAAADRSNSPCRVCPGSEMAQSGSANLMTLNIEGVVDSGVGGKKPLGRTLRFEQLLLSFTASDLQMRILGAIVVL
jgi:hypothetical protein